MPNPYIGAARAVGQGLGMGWGDEAEAWLRSKLGQEDYDQALKQIRQEYGQYSKEHPYLAGGVEFGSAFLPGVAAMLIPGGQVAGATQMTRSTAGALARLAGLGAVTGGVAGAGSSEEGNRASGAASGATLGAGLGVTLPLALRGGKAGVRWMQERLIPTEATVTKRAAEKFNQALTRGEMTPAEMKALLAQDAQMKVPSVVANANPALADLAEAVAQRTGAGARNIEETLVKQKLGARERTYSQVHKALQPGDYYADIADLQQALRTKSQPLYEKAYAHGEVADPEVLKFMALPQFQQAGKEAEKLLAAEGRTVDMSKPTVEVLDQIKRGLDSLIEGQTDAVTGKTTSLGRVYTQKKNEFLSALDKAVPDYALARATYRGDAELLSAMRSGMNDFGKLDHEQVIKLVAGMTSAEKESFRTGVARDMYSKIMNPSGNFNAAQRVIGSPEMQAKLRPLFDNAGDFDLFKSAMERESQLFHQSNKILGGSPTGKRLQMAEDLAENPTLTSAVAGSLTGGFRGGLTSLVNSVIRAGTMTEKTSAKLASMLMSKDPHEVAAVVKLLEEQAAAAAPKAVQAGATEAGVVTGVTSAMWPSPQGTDTQEPLDAQESTQQSTGPDIEADIAADISKSSVLQ